MTSDGLKKYRYDMRNEFLSFIHDMSGSYDDLMYYLGIEDEDNLVKVIRDKVWEIADIFDIIDYNYFFETEIGNVIVNIFSDVLEDEEMKLSCIDASINRSYIINWLYFVKKRFICSKWLVEYRKLCSYYSGITLDNVMGDVIDRFNKYIDKEEEDIRPLLINDFSKEIEFLVNNNKIDRKYNGCLVKKIG